MCNSLVLHLTSVRMALVKKTTKADENVKKDLHSTFVGRKIGVATVEISVEDSQKTKNRPSSSILGSTPKEF